MQEIKDKLMSLQFSQKLILAGSAVTILGMCLPVYSDFNQWGNGVVYLGLTGPLSLVGLVVVATALLPILSLIHPLSRWSHKKFINFDKASSLFPFQALLLTVLMASVFLDSEFGVNISVKELRSGIIIALIGEIIAIIGLKLATKEDEPVFELQHEEIHQTEKPEKIKENIETYDRHPLEDRIHQTIADLKKNKKTEEKPHSNYENKDLKSENYNLRLDL